jgi:hypothetical protein
VNVPVYRECCEFIYVMLKTWPKHNLQRHTVLLRDVIRKSISDGDPDATEMSCQYIHYHRVIELCTPVEPNCRSINSQLTSKAAVVRRWVFPNPVNNPSSNRSPNANRKSKVHIFVYRVL